MQLHLNGEYCRLLAESGQAEFRNPGNFLRGTGPLVGMPRAIYPLFKINSFLWRAQLCGHLRVSFAAPLEHP